jgi:hypothetical protein
MLKLRAGAVDCAMAGAIKADVEIKLVLNAVDSNSVAANLV